MKRLTRVFIILCCALMSACTFHLRSPASFPTALKYIYFSTGTPYSELSTDLRQLLTSMDVVVVNNPKNAAFSIVISNDVFTYSRPQIMNTTLTSTLSFAQTATVSIMENKNKKTLLSQPFSTSQSLTLNANQIYTADANALMKRELNREISTLIYYWLISKQVKDTLHHATITSSTRHTS